MLPIGLVNHPSFREYVKGMYSTVTILMYVLMYVYIYIYIYI